MPSSSICATLSPRSRSTCRSIFDFLSLGHSWHRPFKSCSGSDFYTRDALDSSFVVQLGHSSINCPLGRNNTGGGDNQWAELPDETSGGVGPASEAGRVRCGWNELTGGRGQNEIGELGQNYGSWPFLMIVTPHTTPACVVSRSSLCHTFVFSRT